MARQSIFTTELQLVNFVLNQMGDHRTIAEINPLSADRFTAYVSLAYENCVNEILSMRDWNFARETYSCSKLPGNVDPRAKSTWEINDVDVYNHICNAFLRKDLEKMHGRYFHWWILPDNSIATTFNTANILHLENAVYVDVIEKQPIEKWGACFCNLIINALKRPLTEENTQDASSYKFSVAMEEELLDKAIKEDGTLNDWSWRVKTY